MANDKDRDRAFRRERNRRQRALPRIQRDTVAEVTRLLEQAEGDIRTTLSGAPSEFDAALLPQMQRSIRQTLARLDTTASAAAATGAGAAWQAGIDLLEAPIDAALQLDAPAFRVAAVLPDIDTRQLLAMRSFLTDKMSDVSTSLANRINTELGLTAIGTQNTSDAITKISRLLKEGGRSRAQTILRTELGRAYSVAGQERYAQAHEVLPGLKKQWRRSGKRHSRQNHDIADGQVREADEAFDIGGVALMFPRDPAGPPGETINCGCQSLPFMDSWEVKFPGRKPFTPAELATNPQRRILSEPALTRPRIPDLANDAGFAAFVRGGRAGSVPVAELPAELALGIGAEVVTIRMSRDTAEKQRRHPEVSAADYGRLSAMAAAATVVRDRDRHLVLIDEQEKPWVAVVKATADGGEIYLQSLRRSNARNVAAIRRRGTVIRDGED